MAQRPDLASAMYPALSREARQREAAQRRVDAWRQQQRNSLLESLRAINRRADERKRREASK
jgi:hypothetical protein